MICITATHPVWQYVLVTLGFAIGTLGAAWFARSMWREHRFWPRAYASLLAPASLGCAWVTVMTAINTVHYFIVLAQGMPRC